MKILITGINGLIGKLVREELSDEHEIFGLDRVGEQGGNLYIADVSDMPSLEKAFREMPQIDCIIHLAADKSPDAEWDSMLKNNIEGARNIYECARMFNVPKVIFASTNRVTQGYEVGDGTLKEGLKMISASDQPRPINYYGVSKLFGENIARMYFEKYGIRSVIFRIGSVLDDDNPEGDIRREKTWLSYRDLKSIFHKAVDANIPFGLYYAVSDNAGRFWDIEDMSRDLGFIPQDGFGK